MEERFTGKVIFFSAAKGYGFIQQDSGERDLFVHFTGIEAEGYRTLTPSQRVSYTIVPGRERRGVMAAEVRIED